MAQIFCKYHPDKPASWVCRHCQINYCKSCIVTEDTNMPPCPVCQRAMESLGSGNVIQPFWQRIPKFFLYPLNVTPLVIMTVIAGMQFLLAGSLWGLVFSLVLFVVFIKYAYIVLEQTAQGNLKPRNLEAGDLTEELELPFKQLLIVVLLGLLQGLFQKIGLWFIGALFTSLILPACIMVLAIEHSFFRAINPLVLVGVVHRVGVQYFTMCVFLFLLLISSNVAKGLFYNYLPDIITPATMWFVNMYFILIMFHMMGYVLLQYHEELGFTLEDEIVEKIDGIDSTQEQDPGLNDVTILYHEGKIEEAQSKLAELIKATPGNMIYRERIHKLLINTKNIPALREYSGEYITRLMSEQRPSEAQRVFSDCYKVDKSFKYGTGTQRHAMAELLFKNGQSRAALSLLNNLHKDHPGYEHIPEAYLLVAKILFESFNEEEKAKQILEFVKTKYPHYAQISEIDAYLKVVAKISSNTLT